MRQHTINVLQTVIGSKQLVEAAAEYDESIKEKVGHPQKGSGWLSNPAQQLLEVEEAKEVKDWKFMSNIKRLEEVRKRAYRCWNALLQLTCPMNVTTCIYVVFQIQLYAKVNLLLFYTSTQEEQNNRYFKESWSLAENISRSIDERRAERGSMLSSAAQGSKDDQDREVFVSSQPMP